MKNIISYSFSGLLSSRGYRAIPFGFAVVFFLSGIYEIPSLPLDAAVVTKVKRDSLCAFCC
jgi:hypothetical protein